MTSKLQNLKTNRVINVQLIASLFMYSFGLVTKLYTDNVFLPFLKSLFYAFRLQMWLINDFWFAFAERQNIQHERQALTIKGINSITLSLLAALFVFINLIFG